MLEVKDVKSRDAGIYKVTTRGSNGEEISCEASVKVDG